MKDAEQRAPFRPYDAEAAAAMCRASGRGIGLTTSRTRADHDNGEKPGSYPRNNVNLREWSES